MPQIHVITLFPEMIQESMRHGLLGQALKKNLLSVASINPRDFSQDKHRTADDRPFGGGDGMVMLAEPLEQAIQSVHDSETYVIYLSPQGVTFTSEKAKELSQKKKIVMICGRYGGIDQRVINHWVDEEVSIGDYVLCGGETAALVVTEALSRFIPEVLGHQDSAEKDSFGNGLLEHPNFTRPREFREEEVPEILLSGNHAAIEDWKLKISLLVTLKKRPDLYARYIKIHGQPASKKRLPLHQELKLLYEKMSPQDKKVLDLEDIHFEELHV